MEITSQMIEPFLEEFMGSIIASDTIIFRKYDSYRNEELRYKYWAMSRAQGCQIAQGQINTSEGIQINGPWKKSGYNEQETLSEEKYLLD